MQLLNNIISYGVALSDKETCPPAPPGPVVERHAMLAYVLAIYENIQTEIVFLGILIVH